MATTTSHLDRLNGPQRKAVTHGEALPEKGYRAGPLLIIAGAGTGKTDTLAHRVAHLVINGVDPARILMLTFTRRAALEMRRRAHEITRKQLCAALDAGLHLNWPQLVEEARRSHAASTAWKADVDRVRQLHTRGRTTGCCNDCGMVWPCNTIQALDTKEPAR